MRCLIKGRLVDIDPQPIVIASLILGWTVYYYFNTVNIPDGGPESVLFIRPLVIGILICFPFVVFSAITVVKPENSAPAQPEQTEEPADRGFLDHRRVFFALALIAYAITITFFGYIIPSIVFIFSVLFYLGSRNMWILIVLPVGLISLIALIFKAVLKIPIPLWPTG